MIDPPTFNRVRALLLITAGALGLGMLVGNAQHGPLALGTVLEVLVGWSFVACGIFIWARRPANRLGRLMTTVGMLWLLGRTLTLVPNPVVYTAGLWLTDLWAPAFALFLLSFPTGRLTSRADLAIVGIFLFVTVPLEFLWFLFLVLDNGLNALGIAPNESAAHVIDTIQRDLISLGSVLLVIALGRRWLRSSGPVRRQMTPVLVGAVAILLQSASWILLSSGTRLEPLDDLIFLAQIAIPIAVLFVMLQSRMARAGVADLVVELGQTPTPARLRDALANALGDPSLQVAYWAPSSGSVRRCGRRADGAARRRHRPGRHDARAERRPGGRDHPRRDPARGAGPDRLGCQRHAAGGRERSADGRGRSATPGGPRLARADRRGRGSRAPADRARPP